jgi:signal transduction histidine kinase/ActR/RegA family two-component response regulator
MGKYTGDPARLLEQCARELQSCESRFRNLINKNADGIVIVDREGILRFINPAAEFLFNHQASDLLGTSFGFPMVAGETMEIDVLRAGGETAVAEMRVVETEWEGEPAFLASLRDITDRKRAEEARAQLIKEQVARAKAEEASQMKDEFLATVSHELRAPLNIICGWVGLLRDNDFDPASMAKALTTIERNAKLQAQLIEDLLDISRIVSGKLHLDRRPSNLAPIIKAATEAMRPAAEAKEISLIASLGSADRPVMIDTDRIQQVIGNLLSNAVKFTPPGGRIEVRLEQSESEAMISVRDTGIGISPEFLPHVFERFRQADGGSARKYGGLGLGLSIVRRLVELHNGSVMVESPGEGRGATFMVKMPLAAVSGDEYLAKGRSEDSRESSHSMIGVLELSGLRVLVVDDEADARDLISIILTQSGAEVKAVASAAEALRELTEWRPDALVSDIGMPGEDGYTLIRRLRAMEAQLGGRRMIPAIALTAYARGQERLQALAAGYQAHLSKPAKLTDLVLTIKDLTRPIDQS